MEKHALLPRFTVLGVLIALSWLAERASARPATPAELRTAAAWRTALFKAKPTEPAAPRLTVLANHDLVQLNARNGTALRLGTLTYHRGLFCHAPSRVQVQLATPARVLRAQIGIDSNPQTTGGRGSAVFQVLTNGRAAFQSSVLREGDKPLSIEVPLGDAQEFLLQVNDAGDGIACDQADWAEARVQLADGSELWLGDLPVIDPQTPPLPGHWPFSFQYNGKPASEHLAHWPQEHSQRPSTRPGASAGGTGTEHTWAWTDPDTRLKVSCVATEYPDYPVLEWTVFFKNTGSSPTPVLTNLQAFDVTLQRFAWPDFEETEFFLHHNTGSPCLPTDYEPHLVRLPRQKEVRFAPPGGRPSDSVLPFFNLRWGSQGMIMAVGWPGQWAATFTRDNGGGLRVRAGQELTGFSLAPGETARTPLMAVLLWHGDATRAQNVWRRWMLAHNVPRPAGRLVEPQWAACSSHQFGEMINANEANQIQFVDAYLRERIPLKYWWMDAGWYPHGGGGWPRTGTWEVDTNRFPRGLRAITDHAHTRNLKSIVWFEPERVAPGSWLDQQRPEWLLGKAGGQRLLNLGNTAARDWLINHVDRQIREQGIDLYRQDFNMDPLPYWRKADQPDRIGLTENHHVTGYLGFWDELQKRHPSLLIDSCASGGRRNDLETLRRAVPLLRSDFLLEPASQQNHTYGIAPWIPFYGTGVNAFDAYTFRSQMCPHCTACYDMRRSDLDFEALRKRYQEWQKVARFYYGDFYPLTPYAIGREAWMGWQFDRPDLAAGVVQMFRRTDSIYEAVRLKLRGLEPGATYRVSDLDSPTKRDFTGDELLQRGLPISIPDQPGSVVVFYEKL